MPRLSNIAITHISLVKAGANKKSIIYKSTDSKPTYERDIKFKKSDDEKGIVYGIVYAPEEVDTDGDYASADEIIKAAYLFMKERNTTNVDKQHSFDNEEAFVAESWIVKENDAVFPDEPIGSWAVAIKLESAELKKAVKDGDVAGISMAGSALKEKDSEVEKADDKKFSLDDVIGMFKKIFSSTHVNISGSAYTDLNKSKEGEKEEMKKEELEEVLSKATKPLTDKLEKMEEKVDTLTKENEGLKDELKKSKQDEGPVEKTDEKEDLIKGIM